LVEDVLGGAVELQRPEDLLAQGWYGRGAPHPRVRAALGDYVLVLRERHAIYQRLPGESWHVQVGVHGGLSRAELQVPLVIAGT
jgi:hypothetical protein